MRLNSLTLTFTLTFYSFCSAGAHSIDTQALRELSSIVEACVTRNDTEHPVFHGCVDWHSSVHGHWALVWSANMLNDEALSKRVMARLTPEGLSQELENLRAKDRVKIQFEMPYGRAWFLQLARDIVELHGDTQQNAQTIKQIRSLAKYLYETLMDYARTTQLDVTATDYENASWFMYQLYMWAKYVGNKNDMAELKGMVSSSVRGGISWPEFSKNTGFFDPKSLVLILLSTTDQPKHIIEKFLHSYLNETHKPILFPTKTAHQGGLNYSRSWGAALSANRFRSEKIESVLTTYRQSMQRSIKIWAYDYRRYGHWVAQFGLFSYRLEYLPGR